MIDSWYSIAGEEWEIWWLSTESFECTLVEDAYLGQSHATTIETFGRVSVVQSSMANID